MHASNSESGMNLIPVTNFLSHCRIARDANNNNLNLCSLGGYFIKRSNLLHRA